jgi:hypothetical protein
VLAADEAAMTTLIVIGSAEELPWARDLTRMSCAQLVGTPRPVAPETACDHLYGLFWRIPPRVRGLEPPEVGVLEDGAARIPAVVSSNRGAPYTALEWQFKPKKP